MRTLTQSSRDSAGKKGRIIPLTELELDSLDTATEQAPAEELDRKRERDRDIETKGERGTRR